MKKLEKLELAQASDADRERLAHWLFEWNLLCASIGDDTDDIRQNEFMKILPEGVVAEPDKNIEVGQIRLLAPVSDESMVFIVVVSIDNDIGIVPFSQLSEPATPDELISGRDKDIVSVYCLWNFRKVSAAIIGRGWVIDILDEKEEERLLKALDVYSYNKALPDDLQKDVGPPLIHPDDPRREYKNYERQRIDCAVMQESAVFLYDADKKQEFLKAAESGDGYEA
jgi:hypothetical protein